MNEPHYWVVVAARDHALSGVGQGIVQANHGKAAPLRRMQPGDGVLLYAPKRTYGSKDVYQQFVALGTVADEPVYQVSQPDDFEPFRRRVVYEPVVETPIKPLIDQLSFITNKQRRGYPFRFGCFAISQTDFERICSVMTSHSNG